MHLRVTQAFILVALTHWSIAFARVHARGGPGFFAASGLGFLIVGLCVGRAEWSARAARLWVATVYTAGALLAVGPFLFQVVVRR